MTSLQTLKGFRDFLPPEKLRRDWVAQKIRETFTQSGFLPLETPTLEYKETIMGKYGDEADKLVYTFVDNGGREVALRYDQTVPTARVVAQYQNELVFPFRRYQMQNVFRADKPQKGRYREFTQCDIDIFGSKDALADAEVLATAYRAYKNIGFADVELRVNDRNTLLATLQPFTTETVSVFSLVQSIDKLDKLSTEEVAAELVKKGLARTQAEAALQAITSSSISPELEAITQLATSLGVDSQALMFTPSLARGLDYYTGMIFEVILPGFSAGSVGGGGRYDALIKQLSGVSIAAVGMAFGFDRTVDAALELGILSEKKTPTQVLVSVFAPDQSSQQQAAKLAGELRQAGLAVELYPSVAKLGKQFAYANKAGIPFVAILGPDELSAGRVTLKNMQAGEQQTLERSNLLSLPTVL